MDLKGLYKKATSFWFDTTECEAIAESFAIAFYEWRSNSLIKNIDQYTNAETLRMFKEEKGL